MRIAALYDIHGNLPALEAVLDDLRLVGVDELVVGGDVVPGPMCAESLDRLGALDLPVRWIRGNGEREVVAAADGRELTTVPEAFRPTMHWVAGEIGPARVEVIRPWPLTMSLAVPGVGTVLFCHATPRSDTELFTRLTPDARIGPAFADVMADLVVCGHTHMPFDRRVGRLRVVNPGSVGMPFGDPGAYWLLLDDEGVHFKTTSFGLDEAAARIRETRYPGADAFAANHVVSPPAEAQMLAVFEPYA